MFKKIIKSVLLVVGFGVGLSACGDGDAPKVSSDTTKIQSTVDKNARLNEIRNSLGD